MGVRALKEGDFVWLVESFCRIHRPSFDPASVLERFPPPHSERHLSEALQSCGLRTAEDVLARAVFPCVAFLKGGSRRPAIVLCSDGAKLLYFEAGSRSLDKCGVGDERFEHEALLVHYDTAPRAVPFEDGQFGWRWFRESVRRLVAAMR